MERDLIEITGDLLGATVAWNLPQYDDEVFERNPLVSVICQLRFHPILKIGERVADFQDDVRAGFPGFAEATANMLNVQVEAGGFEVKKEQQYIFRKPDDSSTMTLTTNSLAIENHRHLDRAQLFSDVAMAASALALHYKPVSLTRVGLRYINLLDREMIGRTLGRDLAWDELVTPGFLRLPSDLAELDSMLFFSEVRGPVRQTGALTLRHGVMKDGDGAARFRFDMDRYAEGNVEIDDVSSLLEEFGRDLFSLFKTAMGPALTEWMTASGGG